MTLSFALRRILRPAAWLSLLAVLFLSFWACGIPAVRHTFRYLELISGEMPAVLELPISTLSRARLVDSWGQERDGGRRSHEGVDLFAPRNTPVQSATEGVIERKGVGGLGGRVVWVVGPGGYRHYYAHLENWAHHAEGDWVEAGEVIGFVGNSGNAEGGPTHLHYGIYARFGGAINPFPLLRAEPAPAPTTAG